MSSPQHSASHILIASNPALSSTGSRGELSSTLEIHWLQQSNRAAVIATLTATVNGSASDYLVEIAVGYLLCAQYVLSAEDRKKARLRVSGWRELTAWMQQQ